MKLNLVHLTDIHIKKSDDPILAHPKEIGNAISTITKGATSVVALISGDVAFSGQASQYKLAQDFFSEISDVVLNETGIEMRFLTCPGNHDSDFSEKDTVREIVLKSLRRGDATLEDVEVQDTLTKNQEAFFDFKRRLENVESDVDKIWHRTYQSVGEKTVRFDLINVASCSSIREKPGALSFPVEHPNFRAQRDTDLVIAAFHHPANWLSQNEYRDFRRQIRKISDLVLTGHEHKGNSGFIRELESDESLFFEGYVLQEDGIENSSFSCLEIDFDAELIEQHLFSWDGAIYYEVELPVGHRELSFPNRPETGLSITQRFAEFLEDPGGYFKHPKVEQINLEDIFVYPHLKRDTSEGEDEIVSSLDLTDVSGLSRFLLLYSEEAAGRTALIKILYKQYLNRSFKPIYINGSRIRSSSDKEIRKLLKSAAEAQYGEGMGDSVIQEPKEERIIFIDDFHLSPVKGEHARRKCLECLGEWAKAVIFTVDDAYRFAESIIDDEVYDSLGVQRYQIQPFNYSLRYELIERWYTLGAHYSDSKEYLDKCQHAVKHMDRVVDKSLIPSSPLYGLVLLQGLEKPDDQSLREGGLGYYYQYLITNALLDAGVKEDELGELFEYCGHLAWHFHQEESNLLTKDELKEFNRQFSEKWHSVDYESRIDVLQKARVLVDLGDEFKFRYPYIYYHFKAFYIGKNHRSPDIQKYLQKCCSHLYVRDYANTVLFAAYHLPAEWLVRYVRLAVSGVFEQHEPVLLGEDGGEIRKLLAHAENLEYVEADPAEKRREHERRRDEIEDESDGLSEAEEGTGKLSVMAQIAMLFKSSDILGQILKTQYPSIERNDRIDLIEALFNAPLRTLSDFFEAMTEDPSRLEDEVKDALLERGLSSTDDEARNLARKVVAHLVQAIIFGFLTKTADAVNSRKLREDVERLVSRRRCAAYSLIEIAAILDSSSRLPKRKIDELLRRYGHDIVVRNVLEMMVIRRLYMFQTDRFDMQWARERFRFDATRQRIVAQDQSRKVNR